MSALDLYNLKVGDTITVTPELLAALGLAVPTCDCVCDKADAIETFDDDPAPLGAAQREAEIKSVFSKDNKPADSSTAQLEHVSPELELSEEQIRQLSESKSFEERIPTPDDTIDDSMIIEEPNEAKGDYSSDDVMGSSLGDASDFDDLDFDYEADAEIENTENASEFDKDGLKILNELKKLGKADEFFETAEMLGENPVEFIKSNFIKDYFDLY